MSIIEVTPITVTASHLVYNIELSAHYCILDFVIGDIAVVLPSAKEYDAWESIAYTFSSHTKYTITQIPTLYQ